MNKESNEISQTRWEQIGTGISAFGSELIEIGNRASQSLDFAVMKVVSDEVFETLGFPERDISEEKGYYIYEIDAYFSHIEALEEGDKIKAYCDLLVKTSDIRGRKYIFEEILAKNFESFQVFSKIRYNQIHDSIMKEIFQNSSLYLSDFLLSAASFCKSSSEAQLYFDIIYQILPENSIENSIDICENIISTMGDEKTALTGSMVHKIQKAISILKIEEREISIENIEQYLNVYVFVPNVIGSTHGENSQAISLVKGFVSSHKPKPLKDFKKYRKFIDAFLHDGAYFEQIKRITTRIQHGWNTLLKQTGVHRASSFMKQSLDSFGERKMDAFIALKRRFSSEDSLGGLSQDEQKEILKTYILLQTILSDIENNLQVIDGELEKKPASRVYRFLLGRGKSKAIAPFATQSWMLVSGLFPLMKILSFIPFIKARVLFMAVKTSFVFIFYKLVDLGVYVGKKIPYVERFQNFQEMAGASSMQVSPEFQDYIIQELDTIHDMSIDIARVQKYKALIVLLKSLDEKAYILQEDKSGTLDEINLERGLLQPQIDELVLEMDQEKLGEEIINLKTKYLSLLQNIATSSTQDFLR